MFLHSQAKQLKLVGPPTKDPTQQMMAIAVGAAAACSRPIDATQYIAATLPELATQNHIRCDMKNHVVSPKKDLTWLEFTLPGKGEFHAATAFTVMKRGDEDPSANQQWAEIAKVRGLPENADVACDVIVLLKVGEKALLAADGLACFDAEGRCSDCIVEYAPIPPEHGGEAIRKIVDVAIYAALRAMPAVNSGELEAWPDAVTEVVQ